MRPDDDARLKRVQIAVTVAAGLLVSLLFRFLLTDDWGDASMFGFAAAQLVAELFPPSDGGPPDGGSPAVLEIVPIDR